ncbi:MAG: glycosyltransferase family 2 protein [Oceanihabitans sp.]
MTLFLVLIILIYLLLIGILTIGFDKVKTFTLTDENYNAKFSIIIPFRDEEENLPELLKSISALQYPKNLFEIIFVDDHSIDQSKTIIQQFKNKNKAVEIMVIQNNRISNSPKKDAITTAIDLAKYQWIVTTDADCILPKYWLETFAAFAHYSKAEFIAAPVSYHKVDSFFKRFQLLDFLSLQGATIGGFGIQKPFLCNGANLAYTKELFLALNGFEGNTNIASGDDVFMLEKVSKQFANKAAYLKHKNAIITTNAQKNSRQLISQRVRWAAKASSYNSFFAKLVGLVVLLANASIVTALFLSITGVLKVNTWLCLFLIKCSIDFLLLFKTARFFNQESYLSSFLFSSLLYPFFSLYVAMRSVFGTYKWKGRSFTK